MVERTPLSPHDVVITPTVAKFGNTSYPIAAISSVSVRHDETTNKTFLSTGFLLILALLAIGYFEWASWLQVGMLQASRREVGVRADITGPAVRSKKISTSWR
jgi:cytochrome c-type biogenesis protein CcmH/NrfG